MGNTVYSLIWNYSVTFYRTHDCALLCQFTFSIRYFVFYKKLLNLIICRHGFPSSESQDRSWSELLMIKEKAFLANAVPNKCLWYAVKFFHTKLRKPFLLLSIVCIFCLSFLFGKEKTTFLVVSNWFGHVVYTRNKLWQIQKYPKQCRSNTLFPPQNDFPEDSGKNWEGRK